MTIELGSVSLSQLTHISVSEEARIVRHPVPGMKGDLSQTMGRPSVIVRFQGIFYGPQALDDLDTLRSAYLEQQPVDFFTDAVGEGYFTQVLITRLAVSQNAGYVDQFDYTCEVLEYVEPPEPIVSTSFGLDGLDTSLLDEAAGFIDDVQNALQEVSDLVDLLANIPSFGDPTSRLPDMLTRFTGAASSGVTALSEIRDLLGG
jgi:hypothetical protein